MAAAIKELWNIEGVKIPVNIYVERRNNQRISITKSGVNLRIPKAINNSNPESYRQWANQWIQKKVRETPSIIQRFRVASYVTGHIVSTPYKDYVLDITTSDRITSSGRINDHVLHLTLSQNMDEITIVKAVRSLMSRLIARDQLLRVSKRIHNINDHYFQQPIKGIKIKNNSSNWGSCSSSGNINISTRTLLAPFEVQDYIFVHELAHRIEMNHSPDYWAIVERVMPNYKKHERWIKKNGHLCEL